MPKAHGLYTIFLITLFFLCSLCVPASAQTLPQDKSKAVILAYYEISPDGDENTALSPENFKAHLREIETENYTILSLPSVLEKISSGQNLPPRTLVITFEGAYASTMKNAIPQLQERGWPFTIFYAPETLQNNTGRFMSAEDLKQLSSDPGVTLGVVAGYNRPVALNNDQIILEELNKLRQSHRKLIGAEAGYLSYAHGKYSNALKHRAATQGFKGALSTRSGTVFPGIDLYALPRFTMTDRYGDIDRFRRVANALPLPVLDLEPADPLLTGKPWYAGFTLPPELAAGTSSLQCVLSGMAKPQVQKIGPRIEIRMKEPTTHEERLRLNCTMDGPKNENDEAQTRWFGMLYHRAPQNTTQSEMNPSNPEPGELP